MGARSLPRTLSPRTLKRRNATTRYQLTLVSDTNAAEAKAELMQTFSEGTYPEGGVGEVERQDSSVYRLLVDCQPVDLEVVDTYGLEQEPERLRMAFRYHDIILPHVVGVVVDVSSPLQLLAVGDRWAPELRRNCPGVPWVIIGTRTEKRSMGASVPGSHASSPPSISPGNGAFLARMMGAAAYVECSAKRNLGVHDAFVEAARIAMGKGDKSERDAAATRKQNRFSASVGSAIGSALRRIQSK